MRVTPLKGPIDQEKAIQLNDLLNLTPHLVLGGLTGGRNGTAFVNDNEAYWRAAFF